MNTASAFAPAEEPRWLTDEEQRVWRAYIEAATLLEDHMDRQLQRDAGMPHVYYGLLVKLAESPDRRLRMTELARQTNATLPRLSHVVSRLEARGLVERFPCPEDRRATNARLTTAGWAKVQEAAPGHVTTVRHHVIDALTDEQVDQLAGIGDAILARLDPTGSMAATYTRYDEAPQSSRTV